MIIVVLVSGVTCWLIGGTYFKWVRRIALSIVLGLCVAISGHVMQGVLLALACALVNSLPYGDRTPWPLKVPVFMALCAPALILNLGAWPAVLVGGALISGMAWATRRWNFVTMKIWEAWAGLVQAGVIVIASLI